MKDFIVGTFYLDEDSLNLSIQDDLYELIIKKGLESKLDKILDSMLEVFNEAVEGE